MTVSSSLADLRHHIDQCVRCGACQAHCPVYLETCRESSVARGKIALAEAVLNGAVDLEDRLRQEAGLCLLCGSCAAKCPNQVPADALVAALRERITAARGLSSLGRGVALFTGSQRLLRGLLRSANLFSSLFFTKIPTQSGLRLRFSPAALKERVVPALARHTLFDRLPEFLPGDEDKPVLGVFAGCALTYLYPATGEAMVRLLNRLGYPVALPRSQGCCGMPALATGNQRLVGQLTAANTAAFKSNGTKTIITACATCHGMLADQPVIHGSPGGASVQDIHVFLVQAGLVDTLATLPAAPRRIRVTYHDPCHLRNRGITREPRALLQALPGVELIEMEGAGLCCGMGGTFTAAHPELSRAIGDRKLAGLQATRASVIASSCPGCVLQLQDIITRADLPVKVVHTLDLIDQAMSGEGPA
ncbi:(Fe-S)-binding protein [Desulfobulbus alkaliphilus]|uniref:(Fe-S)-binding protein n=1 Tax=Desulfobulbus alkaliphilus TaxID=869814 RepID=UPI00196329E2|nr:(Fe-S)-binding protein [Desulfobulbus alkaliphilus]MBM9535509.1 (Fe-S)-binding protein [Desulfobulbus alkaliphilus]